MKKLGLRLTAILLGGGLMLAAPAVAGDLCLQYDGVTCPIVADYGLFRFDGTKLPKSQKRSTALHGRSCHGYGTVYGTAIKTPPGDDGDIVLSATFTCDGSNGTIWARFLTTEGTGIGSAHEGRAGFSNSEAGTVDLSSACTVTVVDCALHPE